MQNEINELKKEKIKEEIVKIDETTETMNIINLIKPNKNSELKYEGIIKENNIINNINNRLDYNSINEIDKGEALEINPYEIKRTKSNIIIAYENDIEVLINKNDAFKSKAKQKMIKIILPIRLKSILVKSIRKKIFFKLIKQAHKICFFIHINKILFNYDKKMKKEGIKKLKENSNNIKLKIIIEKEIDRDFPYELGIDLKYIETLDKGSFGTVLHVFDNKLKMDMALKVIDKTGKKNSYINKMKEEISILRKLNHPNIVNFYGFIETNNQLMIKMEYIKYGTLKNWINNRENINEEEASTIIGRILSAIEYLHGKQICHRDIKPENIMISRKNDLKVIFLFKLFCFFGPNICIFLLLLV